MTNVLYCRECARCSGGKCQLGREIRDIRETRACHLFQFKALPQPKKIKLISLPYVARWRRLARERLGQQAA